MIGAVLFLRSRRVWWLPALVVIPWGSVVALGFDLWEVPGSDAIAYPWVIAAVGGLAFAPALLLRPPGDLELSEDGRLWRLRLAWVVSLALLTWVAGMAPHAQQLTPDLAVFLLRNTLLILGLAALSASVLAPAASWVPPLTVLLVMWRFGTDALGEPAPWALLYHGLPSMGAAIASVCGLAAIGWYVVRDSA